MKKHWKKQTQFHGWMDKDFNFIFFVCVAVPKERRDNELTNQRQFKMKPCVIGQ